MSVSIYVAEDNQETIVLRRKDSKNTTDLRIFGRHMIKRVRNMLLPNLTTLFCSSLNVTEVSLSEFPMLQTLVWIHGQLQRLTGLSRLYRLTTLECYCNELDHMDSLAGLTQLTRLDCQDNYLCELGGLGVLTTLVSLTCSCNAFDDLTEVASMTRLTHLECNHNYLKNLLMPRSIVGVIDCSYNCIEEILFPDAPMEMETFRCDGNRLRQLVIPASVIISEFLTCCDNQLTSIQLLAPVHPRVIYARRNKLTSLRDLSPDVASTCKRLYVDGNRFGTLDILPTFKKMVTLSCARCKLSSLHGVERLTALVELDVSHNSIEHLNGLRACTRLVALNCDYNPVREIPVFPAIKKLWRLSVRNRSFDPYVNVFLEAHKVFDFISSLEDSRRDNARKAVRTVRVIAGKYRRSNRDVLGLVARTLWSMRTASEWHPLLQPRVHRYSLRPRRK